MTLLKNEEEWDKLIHLEANYNRFDVQLALLAKLESKKLEEYRDIFCDVLIPLKDIEILENIGEGKG